MADRARHWLHGNRNCAFVRTARMLDDRKPTPSAFSPTLRSRPYSLPFSPESASTSCLGDEAKLQGLRCRRRNEALWRLLRMPSNMTWYSWRIIFFVMASVLDALGCAACFWAKHSAGFAFVVFESEQDPIGIRPHHRRHRIQTSSKVGLSLLALRHSFPAKRAPRFIRYIVRHEDKGMKLVCTGWWAAFLTRSVATALTAAISLWGVQSNGRRRIDNYKEQPGAKRDDGTP
jgi:hypothetical protein